MCFIWGRHLSMELGLQCWVNSDPQRIPGCPYLYKNVFYSALIVNGCRKNYMLEGVLVL